MVAETDNVRKFGVVPFEGADPFDVRLRLGEMQRESYSGAVTAWDDTTLIDIDGKKGYWEVASVYTSGVSSAKDDRILVYIDDVLIQNTKLSSLNSSGIYLDNPEMIRLSIYDTVNDIYRAVIVSRCTYEDSIKIIWRELSGNTPTVSCIVYYTII